MSKYIYILLFILSILISAISQILLKKGSSQKNIYINKFTIFGYTIMIFATFLTLIAYKNVDLSLSQVLQALSFVFVIILSKIFLKEKIDKRKIVGIITIIIGIIVFNL